MQRLRAVLLPHLEAVIGPSGEGLEWPELLTEPTDGTQGDLALPCFIFARALRQAPASIAEAFAQALRERIPSDVLESIQASNGYLNVRASPIWIASNVLASAREHGERYGCLDATEEEYLVEHTSANPNGPFHIGRARNAILGDSLVRLLRMAGHKVRAEYYVDDLGKQVAILAWSLEHLTSSDVDRILEADGRKPSGQVDPWSEKADHTRVRWYQAANLLREEEASVDEGVADLIHRSETGDDAALRAFEEAYQPVLDGMLTTLSRLGVTFDVFTPESKFLLDGSVDRLMLELRASELHGVAENGAEYLDLGARGLKGKPEFFYRRSDGSSLYATRDLAYHRWKWTQSERLINILGEDHRLQSEQVGLTLEELGVRRPEVIFYAFIKLPEGKMSTRAGRVVFMDDLIEEAIERAREVVLQRRGATDPTLLERISTAVAASAIRFNIIKVSPEKGITFRWEEALSFDGGSAPFIMYSHTRAVGIHRKVSEVTPEDQSLAWDDASMGALPESMLDLLRMLERTSDVVRSASDQRRPHLLAKHLLELAQAYNGFYRDCPVMRDDVVDPLAYAVSEACRHQLRNGMQGIGIVPLDAM